MKKIDVSQCNNLESVVNTLLDAKVNGDSVYCEFNGYKFYSDTVSMDTAFIEVTGKTKADFDREQEELRSSYKIRQIDGEQRAKDNVLNWIEKGQSLIFPERYAEWEKCVIARASDLYYGLELDRTLEIMEVLENGASIEDAKQIFDEQENFGMFSSMVRNILFEFSSRGPEFWEATSYSEISPEDRQMLETKQQENAHLVKLNASKASGLKL